MGIDFAGPYSCLTIGYLERSKLFDTYIPRFYSTEDAALIKKMFKRYVDDGFILWPKHLDIDRFIEILNQLHPSIRFTIPFGMAKKINVFTTDPEKVRCLLKEMKN